MTRGFMLFLRILTGRRVRKSFGRGSRGGIKYLHYSQGELRLSSALGVRMRSETRDRQD